MVSSKKKVFPAILLSACVTTTVGFGSLAADTQSGAKLLNSINVKETVTPFQETKGTINEAASLAVETQKWYGKALPNTDQEADVYREAKADSAVAGKMFHNTIVDVVEKGEEWSKISSGSLTGYVKNESLVFGKDAVERSKTVCPEVASPTKESVELKAEPGGEAKGVAQEGTSYSVLANAEGWVKVQDEAHGEVYILDDAVTITRDTQNAKTVEEIEAERKAAEEAARKAAEEAARKAAQEEAAREAAKAKSQTLQQVSSQPVSVSSSDQALMAAIIFCEAGNQPYEGQVAVGAVIMNRVRSGSYPNTIRDVIYQPGQFGPAITGKLDRVLAAGSYTDTAMRAAADALAGANPIGNCLYFGNGNYGQLIGDHYFH